MNERIEGFGHTAFCFCGTCQEAYEAGLKAALQSLEHQCPQWLIQTAHAQIAVAHACLIMQGVRGGGVSCVSDKIEMRMFEMALDNSEDMTQKLTAVLVSKEHRN